MVDVWRWWGIFSSMTRLRATLPLLIGILLLAGCTVSQQLDIQGDGSGTAELDISIHPIMIAYYNDLMVAMSGVEGEYPVFDLEALATTFAQRPGAELLSVEQLSRGRLRMAMAFSSVSALSESGRSEFITFEESGRERTVRLQLDRGAIDEFLAFAPQETVSMTQFLFPPADGSMSASEFEEQMAWALEEYGDAEAVRDALSGAVIEVRVRTQGRITAVDGGRRDGDVVVFQVPVIEALTLQQSRTYSVSFEL